MNARRVPPASLALLLLAVATAPASARERFVAADPFSDAAPRQARPRHPGRRALPPSPVAIISGYLPRNHNVPMYNEPPRRGPAW